jgi:hypothetical protein
MDSLNYASTGDLDRRVSQLESQLRALLGREHNEDGTHQDVTVDSLTLHNGEVGEVTALAHTDARFFAAFTAGTWDITTEAAKMKYLRVSRVGRIAFVSFRIEGTVIATDSVEELWIRLPELHAVPAQNAAGVAVSFAGGVCYWLNADTSDVGMGLVAPAADGFSNTVPGTLLVVTKYDSSAKVLTQWPISSNLTIDGSAWFFLEPNNTPTPFFGA